MAISARTSIAVRPRISKRDTTKARPTPRISAPIMPPKPTRNVFPIVRRKRGSEKISV